MILLNGCGSKTQKKTTNEADSFLAIKIIIFRSWVANKTASFSYYDDDYIKPITRSTTIIILTTTGMV